jgi:hypothetical protein
MRVEIRLSPEAMPALAEPCEALLRAVCEAAPERHYVHHAASPSRGDPVAIAALILSIPGAILATMDLLQRARVAERVRALLKQVRETQGSATLQVSETSALDLKTATADEVVNLLAKSRLP